MNALIKKWNLLYNQADVTDCCAAKVLTENYFLLPSTGTALDLACGLGANALYLAQQGLAVTAWDISNVAIDKLKLNAATQRLTINACQENIRVESFAKCCFDVIVVSRFLDRALSDAIIGAMKPNGLLFYQTFNREKTNRVGPNNPDYLLAEGELCRLFAKLKLVFYTDYALIGDTLQGLRNEAQFIGQKYSNEITA
jgi:2-polyprenyl-3-methyl-5-hydroxy-6-metoxy-1,4-benzoquinol methylase